MKPGPDWNEDQFEKRVTSGTVLEVKQLATACAGGFDEEAVSFEIHVQWDNNEVAQYQWGNNDEYQIELDM